MATSPAYNTMLLVLLVQTLVFFIQPSSSNDLIDVVCKTNDYPTLCASTLNGDARSPGADLALLGEIAIDHGLVTTTNATNLIITLNGTTNDDRLKEIFNTCTRWYDFAIDDLENASIALKSQSYDEMNQFVGSAAVDAKNCEDAFKEPPARSSPLTALNQLLFCVSEAGLAVANLLGDPPVPPPPSRLL